MPKIDLDTLKAAFPAWLDSLAAVKEPTPSVTPQRAQNGSDALANARGGAHWNGNRACDLLELVARQANFVARQTAGEFAAFDPALAEAFVLWNFDLTGKELPLTLDIWVAEQLVLSQRGPSGGGR